MRKDILIVIAIFMLMANLANQQTTRRYKGKENGKYGQSEGIINMIVNTILPGPSDASILTRIFNKIGYLATGIIGTLISSVGIWFKFFKNQKTREERINEYFGDQKHKFAIDAEKESLLIGEKVAVRIIYDLNSKSDKPRTIAIKSENQKLNYNISVEVQQIQDESLLINTIHMKGDDPQGKSIFTGFITFKDKLMEIRMEQTYLKNQKKDVQSRICYFSGRQIKFQENLIQGEWWIEGQKGTTGAYSGKWTFSY